MVELSQARRAFLDALAIGESGGRYDILCGGGRFSDYSAFPQWSGVQGPAGVSHAAGKYQFEPATWQEEAAKLHLQDFSPASQDAAAWDLAQAVYQRVAGRDLAADLMAGDASHVAHALHSTWTSLGSSFPTRYLNELGATTGVVPAPSAPAVQPPASAVHAHPVHTATAAGGLAGAVVLSLIWVLGFWHITVPDQVQAAFTIIATSLGSALLHWVPQVRVMVDSPKA